MHPLRNHLFRLARTMALICLLAAAASSGHAQPQAFAFQGRLNNGALPANGTYDFRFTLRDSLTGGAQVGTDVMVVPLPVTNGLFSVSLNFGDGAFNGAARWLEMGVRTNGSTAAYTTLSPRQSIGATPSAIYASAPAGPAGPKGDTGAVGAPGPAGPPGPKGEDAPTEILAQLTATNAALVAEIAGLKTQLTTLSNYVNESNPSGSVVMSIDPDDASLIGKGYMRFTTLAAPQWSNGSSANAPSARSRHTGIWTGSEIVIWGGFLGGSSDSGSGARYSASLDQWTTLPSFAAPSARGSHSAIWTGTEMIIWGGFTPTGPTQTGGRFSGGAWQATSTVNAPAARGDHIAIWTGDRMIVWGGRDAGSYFDDGAVYNPTTNGWAALPSSGPAARYGMTGVWTGDRLIVWGGEGLDGYLSSGACLRIADGVMTWEAISTAGAPSPRKGQCAIWTGTKMLVWGGHDDSSFFGDGAAYDPATDLWTSLPNSSFASARTDHAGIWTGAELVIFGGADGSGALGNGAAYNPSTGQWRSLDGRGSTVARSGAAAVWSGTELILFGGESNGSLVGSLQRLNVQPAWHLFRKS